MVLTKVCIQDQRRHQIAFLFLLCDSIIDIAMQCIFLILILFFVVDTKTKKQKEKENKAFIQCLNKIRPFLVMKL